MGEIVGLQGLGGLLGLRVVCWASDGLMQFLVNVYGQQYEARVMKQLCVGHILLSCSRQIYRNLLCVPVHMTSICSSRPYNIIHEAFPCRFSCRVSLTCKCNLYSLHGV